MKQRGLTALALVPVVLVVTELVLWFTGLRQNEYREWVSDGANHLIGFLAIMGFLFLPPVCLVPEIAGLVLALKKKTTVFRIVFLAEVLVTLAACGFSAIAFYQGLSI